eukprot:TRINITY_DN4204_c0_g1_i3.p1 TRINITY_DN4204_c0_g1~~TRINITY_DN4204_c0_g1_i3.p1  ORF type:complete len:201 (-),score=21.88 TRINITY_DN4204_c0_g1_i3:113-715(-)
MEQQLWLLLVICSVSLLEAYSTDNCTQIVPPNNCTKFDHNCSLCVLNEGCGYCQNYGQCVPGDSIGPNIKGYCCDVWSNSENSCLESVCSGHGSCDACSKLVYCNWCESSNLCMPGGIFGPYVNHSLCSDWRWAHCGGLSGDKVLFIGFSVTGVIIVLALGSCIIKNLVKKKSKYRAQRYTYDSLSDYYSATEGASEKRY